jgi:hypothetical protein
MRDRFHVSAALVALLAQPVAAGSLGAQNLLVNPSFETGTLTGWTLGGNSRNAGVGADAATITGASTLVYGTSRVNARTGGNAAFGVIRCGNLFNGCDVEFEAFTLSQTVAVQQNTTYDVGFFLGNSARATFGGVVGGTFLDILVDGVGLLPNDTFVSPLGSTSADFIQFAASFASGARTSVNVTFRVAGSGTARAAASVDDAFLVARAPVTAPEPATMLLLAAGLVPLAPLARREKAIR